MERIKAWMKMGIAVSPYLMILWAYFGEGIESDFRHMEFLIRRLRRIGLMFKHVIADKGYYSSKNRQLIRDYGSIPVIPVRHISDLHKKADEEFNKKYRKIYAKRNCCGIGFLIHKEEIWRRVVLKKKGLEA